MISKKTHESLIKKWKKHGKVYSIRSKRVIDRMKWLNKHLHLLEDMNVLDVGCNSGLFAIDICKHCNWYIGLEKKKNYYKQSLITKEYINKELGIEPFHTDSVFFLNLGLGDWDRYHKPNAVVLMRVLYYLKDKEIDILKEILKNCKYALVFCGSVKDRKNNSYGFHEIQNVGKFFEDQGFKFALDYKFDRGFGGVAIK